MKPYRFVHLTCQVLPLYLGKSRKKVIFQHYYSYTSDYLHYFIRKQITTVILQLQLFTYCCLVLPVICIDLVLRLGHATGGACVLIWTMGHVVACSSGMLQHGLNFSTAWCTVWLISVEKRLETCSLTQKVVTLNTCCDIACLTFQLPYIKTSSFQSHRRQLTTGSLQSLQRLKECNRPLVRSWRPTNSVKTLKAIFVLLLLVNTRRFLGLPGWAGTRKVKTNLDFTEARDSEWQLHQTLLLVKLNRIELWCC